MLQHPSSDMSITASLCTFIVALNLQVQSKIEVINDHVFFTAHHKGDQLNKGVSSYGASEAAPLLPYII